MGDHPAWTPRLYKGRNVVERSFNTTKQWRGLATRYDKHAITYRAAAVLSPSSSGSRPSLETRPSWQFTTSDARIKFRHLHPQH